MAYKKKPGQIAKLRQRFIDRNNDRWNEYTLLGEYHNNTTKTLMRHDKCGHEWHVTPHNFSQGHGCPKCGRAACGKKILSAKGSSFLTYISERKDEYELLSQYTNQSSPVAVKHLVCGTVFQYTPVRVHQTLRSRSKSICPKCNRASMRGYFQHTLDDANARLLAANHEYEFLTYDGAKEQATVRHKVCGEVFSGKASYFLLGEGHCPVCTTNISKGEREVYEWVKTLCPDTRQSVRDLGWVSELDIYIPSKGVAIEFNGHYWHSLQAMMRLDKDGKPRMSRAKAQSYHKNKTDACEEHGVRLIHIWDYEWEDERQRKVLKNIIRGALGMLEERYYARECNVCFYDVSSPRWDELGEFFAQNNIQGNRGGSMVFTLEKDGRVLMAYKFGRPSGGKAKQKYEYEMVRGASAPGVQVVGGATRLWAHFVNTVKPKSVVYYIDRNYFDGRSVEKLGGQFVSDQVGVKNYWVKEKLVKNREPRRHKEVKQAIEDGDVLECWNAGTRTYTFSYEKGSSK